MDASVAEITWWHDPDTANSTRAKRRGPDGIIGAPWVLAVAADAERELSENEDEDGHGWFKPVIKVAAGNLATAFWHDLDLDTVRNGDPYRKITRFTRGVDLRGESVGADSSHGSAARQNVWLACSVPPRMGKRRRLA